jgi:hypothetical protein
MIGKFIDPNILCFSCKHGIVCRKIDFPYKECYLNQNLYNCPEFSQVTMWDNIPKYSDFVDLDELYDVDEIDDLLYEAIRKLGR